MYVLQAMFCAVLFLNGRWTSSILLQGWVAKGRPRCNKNEWAEAWQRWVGSGMWLDNKGWDWWNCLAWGWWKVRKGQVHHQSTQNRLPQHMQSSGGKEKLVDQILIMSHPKKEFSVFMKLCIAVVVARVLQDIVLFNVNFFHHPLLNPQWTHHVKSRGAGEIAVVQKLGSLHVCSVAWLRHLFKDTCGEVVIMLAFHVGKRMHSKRHGFDSRRV